MPGVTRDLVTQTLNWGEGKWDLTDFPGLESDKSMQEDEVGRASIEKAAAQLEKYNLLLWVVTRKGLSSYEYDLLDRIRKLKKPVWLVVNFVDDPALESDAAEFYALGFSRVFFISALNNRRIEELRDAVIDQFEGKEQDVSNATFVLKLSLIGKPNVGKSTLFNTFLGKERSLVYDLPGTTRDAIDEKLIFQNTEILLTDTAGIRRKKTSFEAVEIFSVARTKKAIAEADVVLLLIDAREGFDRQNKYILEWIEEENKPVIVIINKTDLIDEDRKKFLKEEIEELQGMFWNFPVQWLSAISSKNSGRALNEAVKIFSEGKERIATPELNNILEILNRNPVVGSNGLKFNYITQAYPEKKFIIFGNRAIVPENVKRYLKHNLLKQLKWKNIPIKLDLRKKRAGLKKSEK